MNIYKLFVKPFVFRLDPEQAHLTTLSLAHWVLGIKPLRYIFKQFYSYQHPSLERELWGLKFPNPVGLAAGFDKNAEHVEVMSAMGFGFIEIGTVTPKPQDGNPKPRLFRLPADQGIINRMGFNNHGADAVVENLKKLQERGLIIGGNIGKNKVTENEHALSDYAICYDKLHPHVDYFVVNVSSPNTPNLRELQEKEPLKALLNGLQTLNKQKAKPRPILLKIAPDLSNEQLDDIIEIVRVTGIQGVIATNTTIERNNLKTPAAELENIGAGGLSGKPLKSRSTEVIKYLHSKSGGAFPIIAVGGIQSAADAKAKLDAGASLVQVYSGLIYEGPGLVKQILKGLVK
jgi:dihydroorotate dehydrogenase